MPISKPAADNRPPNRNAGDMTDFGYARVPTAEKTRRVRNVFENVAPRYDLMNDLMSWGAHRLWKDALVREAAPRPGMTLLDLAGGTGDIAVRLARRRRVRRPGSAAAGPSAGPLLVCDINPAMLEQGRDRLVDRGVAGEIDWIAGDAESLPLPDASVDLATMAFGLRNVTDKPRALREVRRILKPGGRFLCLEFSQPSRFGLQAAYDLYSFTVLPALGRAVAGDASSYRYLAESIRMFPGRDVLADMMRQAGFDAVYHRALSGGIVALHGGRCGPRR